MNKKVIYFDDEGKPHDGFVINDTPDGNANILYHPKPLRRFWNYPNTKELEKKWKVARNIVHKDKAEKIIEIITKPDGTKEEEIKGIKNCYKVIE